MRKRYDRKEADKRLKRRMVMNWIIMGVSAVLIIICYYFL